MLWKPGGRLINNMKTLDRKWFSRRRLASRSVWPSGVLKNCSGYYMLNLSWATCCNVMWPGQMSVRIATHSTPLERIPPCDTLRNLHHIWSRGVPSFKSFSYREICHLVMNRRRRKQLLDISAVSLIETWQLKDGSSFRRAIQLER